MLTFLAANSNFTYMLTKETWLLAAQANKMFAFSFCQSVRNQNILSSQMTRIMKPHQ